MLFLGVKLDQEKRYSVIYKETVETISKNFFMLLGILQTKIVFP